MKKISITVCAMMLAMNCVSPASPVKWKVSNGGNGHFYDSIQCGKLTWNDADAAARASSYKGVQGHLVDRFLAGVLPKRSVRRGGFLSAFNGFKCTIV